MADQGRATPETTGRAPLSSAQRIAFFGTPDFAVPTLEALIVSRHCVAVAVTQPDRGRGRGRSVAPSPVADCAKRAGVPTLKPEKVGAAECVATLRDYAPDVGVVVAFGQFVPKTIRELPRCGYTLNAHASLLPRHRGAAPIVHAILAGDKETGITVMRVEREMDAGAIAFAHRTPILPDDNAGTLSERLATMAATAIVEAIEATAQGNLHFEAQPDDAATVAPKVRSADAQLDFGEDAEALVRRIRAMAPTPGGYCLWHGERLRLLAARAEAGQVGPPGRVVCAADGPRIATGRGLLVPLRLQRAGAKALDVADFQRGRGLRDDDQLTNDEDSA